MKSTANRTTTARPRAFSLIEVLVAIALAAVGFATMFELFPFGFAASARSESRIKATAIASDIMASYRRVLQAGPNNYSLAVGFTPNVNVYKGYDNPNGVAQATYAMFAQYTQTYTETQLNCGGVPGNPWNNDYTKLPGVTGDPTYYFKVWVDEVIDPTSKFEDASDLLISQNLNIQPKFAPYAPDLVNLRRVTVFVRGPLPSFAAADAFNGNLPATQTAPTTPSAGAGGGVGTALSGSAVEVRLVSYVANPRLATFELWQPAGPGALLDNVGISLYTGQFTNRLYLSNTDDPSTNCMPDNFTVFNRAHLSQYEYDDTGPYSHRQASILNSPVYPDYCYGLNELHLDNIWIGFPSQYDPPNGPGLADYDHNFVSDPQGANLHLTGEGNKVIGIGQDQYGYWYLTLLNPIRGLPNPTSSQLTYTYYPTYQYSNPAGYSGPTYVYGTCSVQTTQ